jgi:hypothetical protein
MNTRTITISVIMAFVLAACGKSDAPPVPAAQSAAQPDLAAECSKTAAAWFRGAYGEGSKTLEDGRVTQASHQAHYNTERRQCLVRLSADTSAQGDRAAISIVSVHAVGDESVMPGSVVHVGDKLTHCVLEGKTCHSAQEWESLAAPLLRE